MKRWSKLQKQIYNLIVPGLDFQIHCSVYRTASPKRQTAHARYWITLQKEIIWDYPKQFVGKHAADQQSSEANPNADDISDISALFRDYIDTPKDQLFSKIFPHDRWGLVDILKAADRRIGLRRLETLKENKINPAAVEVIQMRQAALNAGSGNFPALD
jgi:hypothetical protein